MEAIEWLEDKTQMELLYWKDLHGFLGEIAKLEKTSKTDWEKLDRKVIEYNRHNWMWFSVLSCTTEESVYTL